MTKNSKNFDKEVDNKGCKMVAALVKNYHYVFENSEGKVFTLEKDMSISFEPVPSSLKSKKTNNLQVNDMSSIAKLELESIDEKHAVLRCRTAYIKNTDTIYDRVMKNERGKIELRSPYNPENDRYLDVDFENQMLTITRRFKRKEDEIIRAIDLKTDKYLRCRTEGISQKDFALIINDLLLKNMNAMLFIPDDFLEPIINTCKKYKKFNYIIEMSKDPVLTQQSPIDLILRGFLFDKPLSKKLLDGEQEDIDYDYDYMTKMYQISQIASVLFFMTNPGVESVFKSIYKPILLDNLKLGQAFVSSDLAKALHTNKTGLKAMNETFAYLTDSRNLMSQGTIQIESEVGQLLSRKISRCAAIVNDALKAFKGYNNYIKFLDCYFADYWYYKFLIESNYVSSTGVSFRLNSFSLNNNEEELFYEKMERMGDCLFFDLSSLIELIEEPGAPTYTNNMEHFFEFFINGCRKQGFTSVTAMCSLMKDYISMQQKMGARVEKYPTDISMAHNIANANTRIYSTKEKYNPKDFTEAVASYSDLSYSNKEFIIMTPEYFVDLFVEGASLNHCVANYISKVNNKECKILFLRKKDDVTTPYYTICIEGKNKITQVKGLNQKDPDKAELRDFIYEWADKNNLVPLYL